MDFLNTLNPPQREAVTHAEGPLLILAGAGSGKTRVITYRVAYLIAEKGVAPHHILAVTFTNKAAGEMKERVFKALSGTELQSAPLISTFHALCVRILRRDITELGAGYTKSFTIYDQDDSVRLIKQCIRDNGYDDKQLAPRATQSAISAAKNQGLDAELYAARVEFHDDKRAAIARVFKTYEERLAQNNALDFDDLLIKTVALLRQSQKVREFYNDKFRYLLVDEYQDTNALQFALIRYLTQRQQNVCVVGDESQSIYAFRGADIQNILNFEEQYKNARVIRLEQNYRSTQNILDAADAVIRNNTERRDKKLWTANATGDKIRYCQARDADEEARFVAAKVAEHRRYDHKLRAAVLYRTNSQSRVFEEALRRAMIPYNIVGGFSFYERMEVKDIIAYLKLALNPHDSIALLRVINSPARGIGKTTLDELERRAKDYGVSLWETIAAVAENPDGMTPRAVAALRNFQAVIQRLIETAHDSHAAETDRISGVVKAAIEQTGYAAALNAEGSDESEARLANLEELVNAAVDFDHDDELTLRDFIDHAALVSDTDQLKSDSLVTLMTIHAAKGLEFPLVFLVGLEEGLLPHARAARDPRDLEEERRLCYVAITRAEQFLYISHAVTRRVYGEEMQTEPSQFLNELPLDLIEDLTRGSSWLSFARKSAGNRHAARALSGEMRRDSQTSFKTYDSVDAIADFFRKRGQNIDLPEKRPAPPPQIIRRDERPAPTNPQSKLHNPQSAGFLPGTHVRHPKYGRGLVLKREGSGDNVKLTVNFPGYGPKKLMEKYAGLEKA
jgi:DNA helicase-2/ATP-dependent DNA helicase PcrA